jgi:hypothetical protein
MKHSFKFLLAMTPMFLMAACGGGDDSLDDRADIADPKVRLVHAVPLGPNVTLYRNDVAAAPESSNVPYLGATNYFDVDSGNATWAVRTTTGNASIGSQTFDASRGNKYTLVAVPAASSLTEVIAIRDPYNRSLANDDAHLRVVNAAFNAPDVDVYVTQPTIDIATVGPNFSSIDYRAVQPASGSDSTEFEGATDYRIRVTIAGTKTVIFDTTTNISRRADWLLTLVPDSVVPNDIKVLRVESDSSSPAVELSNAI